ncbi:hypothetical protein PSV08DRAFT_160270, partial [Bipolaris maydis]|uniref:uncharacterized protein n=1 Tax=Cochliobolus heterostrophus TaxID=5016 RepID=UPI0024D08F4D
LSSETWELILKHVPEELRWDIDYTELYQSPPCWTLTPSPSLSLDSIPLTIAGAPVIIPVSFRYDLRPALSSPLDPHLELISPSISLKKKVVDAIFNTYDNPIDFYVLANGWLQIIVDEGFDSTDTLSHKPQTFGGPRVSYIQQTTRPCVSRTSISFNAEANQSSTSTTTMLCIGGLIKARISGSKSSAVDFEGRIGVMTKFEGRLYVTVSTHMGTEAWLSTKKVANLDVSWKDNVKLYSAGGTIKDARIALTFDPETGVFPIGFLHDTSLVEVTTLHDLQDTLRCPYPTDWLSDAEWSEPK